MNLVRRLALPLLLFSIISGCTTVSPWEDGGTYSIPLGVPARYTENAGTKIKKEKRLDILPFFLEGEVYKAEVTESLNKKTYTLEKIREEQRMEERILESQTTTTNYTGLGIAGGSIVGLFLGTFLARAGSDKGDDEALGEEGTLPVLGGLALGGALGGVLASSAPPTITVKTRETSNGISIRTSTGNAVERFVGGEEAYSGKNPGRIKWGFKGQADFETDEDGWIIIQESPNLYFTRGTLERGLGNFPLLQQTATSEVKKKIEAYVLETIPLTPINLIAETRVMREDSDEVVINDSESFDIKAYQVTEDLIYQAVKKIVDEEINSKIKPVEFVVEDKLTHFPIENSIFSFNASAPSKTELAGNYFSGELQKYAEKYIKDYLTGGRTSICPRSLMIYCYCPSNIEVEVVNAGYNFVQGSFTAEDSAKKTVRMIDKGQKVRVENSLGDAGGIE